MTLNKIAASSQTQSENHIVTPMPPRLRGIVSMGRPVAHACVTVVDARGGKRRTSVDPNGNYDVDIGGMVAPLLVSVAAPDHVHDGVGPAPWAQRMGALLGEIAPAVSIANINALTDKIVSDLAKSLGFKGPQDLIDQGRTEGITATHIREHTAALRPAIEQALRDAGVVNVESFDPVSAPLTGERGGMKAVLDVLVHSRGYDNNSGAPGATILLDVDYRYVGKLDAISALEPLDLGHAQRAKAQILDPTYTRVMIVGDSTASRYEIARMPRMGWGQVFEELFEPAARVKVVDGAKSGRSSRAFYMQGYYALIEPYLRPGDYVFIHKGHNDQSCDLSRKDRGAADVANLCTYPNDAYGRPQFPPGREDMSFQRSLERYIRLVRAKGAIPILMTPTTRVWNAAREEGQFPVVANHFTMQNAAGGFAFVGDYSQTIRDTARVHQVPLIDIETKSIAFANSHAADWKSYWLAAQPTAYPWYAEQSKGSFDKPDTTHFQEAGARAVAAMVAEGISETPQLSQLAAMLK